jgi:hypothetical protein
MADPVVRPKTPVRPPKGWIRSDWFLFPKISSQFPIDFRPNISLFALKTPLPAAHQVFFDQDDRWTVELAARQACDKLSIDRAAAHVISIDTNFGYDPMDVEECKGCGIKHLHIPVGDDFAPDSLTAFCSVVSEIASPGPPEIVLVSSPNGIAQPGFFIVGFLMWFLHMPLARALDLFRDNYHPLSAPKAIEQLLLFQPDEPAPDPSTYRPRFLHRTIRYDPLEFGTLNSRVQPLQHLASLGGRRVTSSDLAVADSINTLIQSLQFVRLSRGGDNLFPTTSVWRSEHLAQVRMHRFRCTYAPRGPTGFVVIPRQKGTSVSLYIAVPTGGQGHQFMFGFRAEVRCPMPVICLTTVANIGTPNVTIVLTDICMLAGREVSRCDLGDRLSMLYWDVLEKVKLIDGVQLAFRPVAPTKQTNQMLQIGETILGKHGIVSDGLVLMAHSYPAGMTYYIPVKPSVRLVVFPGMDRDVVLYGREDNGTGIHPLFVRTCPGPDDVKSFIGQTVRFEFVLDQQKIRIIPIAVEFEQTPDFAGYVQDVYNYMLSGASPKEDLEEIEKTSREYWGQISTGSMG